MRTRSWAVSMTVLLAMLALIAACGGGGGGGGGGGTGGGGPLATGEFTKTVDLGGASAFGAPFINSAARTQLLFLATDIKGSGKLKSIAFVATNNETITTCPNVVVKAGHSLVSALTVTYASNLNSGSTQTVYNGALTIPATASGGTYTLTFSQSFDYNGVDNLIFDFDWFAACNQRFEIEYTNIADRALFEYASGAATGTLYGVAANVKFTFAGGDDVVEYGGVSGNTWPLNSARARAQYLYLASEISGAGGGGPITGIAFPVNVATAVTYTYTATIKLAHTLKTSLSMTWAENYDATPTTVANEVTFSVPAGLNIGDYFWIPIPSAVFAYDGTRNLLVEFDFSAASGNTSLRHTIALAGRRVPGYHTDGAVASGAGQGYLPDIKIRFNGGLMAAESLSGFSGTSGISFPLWNTDGKVQQLFLASELGTAGNISKIACRARYDAASESGLTYTIVMSHTTATTLGTSLTGNLISPVTASTGSFSIPAVKQGDWYDIPLSSAIAYNGKDNLVVQIAGTGGIAGNAACMRDTTNAAFYSARETWSSSATATTAGAVENNMIYMRFTMQ